MLKKILWVVLIMFLIGAAIGYYMWNKPKRNIATADADVIINADSLYICFEQDEKKANARFLNKVIDVKGKVSEVSENQNHEKVLILASPSGMMGGGIAVTLLKSDSVNYSSIHKDDEVKLKGLCNGFTMDVVLTNASVVK